MQQTVMYPAQKKKFEMSGSTLKIIAIITMLIDHLGAGLLGRILNNEGIVDALEKGQHLSHLFQFTFITEKGDYL